MIQQYKKYTDTAIKELNNPTFNITKQYLAVMKIDIENDAPKIARISNKPESPTIDIYFHIKHERFFLVVSVRKKPIEVDWIWIESGHQVYFTATSKELTYNELTKQLSLSPLSGWSKEDKRKQNQQKYTFSRVIYEPNTNEAYELEEKLIELLSELEKDTQGVRSLSKIAETSISICRHQYISANTGIHFNMDIISRLNKLNLEIDIDTYISGTEII